MIKLFTLEVRLLLDCFNENDYKNNYKIEKNYLNAPLCIDRIKLYQIGRVYCNSKTVIPRHTHLDFFELTIVTDGRGIVVTNGEEIAVKSGDIYVSFVGDFHEIRSDARDPLKFDFIAMQTDTPELLEDLNALVTSFHAAERRVIRSENIAALVSNAIAEVCSDSEYGDTLISAAIMQIFIYMIREFKCQEPVKYAKSVGEAEILCYQIMHYIDTHIYSMKNLRELCEVTNYNYNYLSNLYKKVTSDTLANYFRSRRLETARLLLAERAMSVTKIASLLNYSSVYIFSRAFKEKYGVPPSEVGALSLADANWHVNFEDKK